MTKLYKWFLSLFHKADNSKMVQELIETHKKVVELEKRLLEKRYELITIPTGEEVKSYHDTLELFNDNRFVRTFFVMRERELIQKFKDGGDAEILRGALVAIDDIVSNLQAISRDNKLQREKVNSNEY